MPEFNTSKDRNLTFRSVHVHATGIHFPWSLAFSRLFYFHTWNEALIAHCEREWEPGAKHRYGVVGVILSVRALEILRGRNYWDAMERDLFEPLGIRNVLPGGKGFSAENLARVGVLLDNRGKYGNWEVISEETHQAILPKSLKPFLPELDMKYGIGFKIKPNTLAWAATPRSQYLEKLSLWLHPAMISHIPVVSWRPARVARNDKYILTNDIHLLTLRDVKRTPACWAKWLERHELSGK